MQDTIPTVTHLDSARPNDPAGPTSSDDLCYRAIALIGILIGAYIVINFILLGGVPPSPP